MDYQGTLTLMKLKGAQCLTVTMSDGRNVQGVFIPAAYNDMIRKNKQTGEDEIAPYLNLRVRVPDARFIEACNRRHVGEPDYVAPSHTIDLSLSKDFRERAMSSARSRIIKERKEAGLPDLTEDELTAEARRATYISLGSLTPVAQPQPRGYASSAVVSATEAPVHQSQFVQPREQPAPQSEAPQVTDDDLPF